MLLNVENIPLAAGYLKAMAYKQGLLKDIDFEILDDVWPHFNSDKMLIDSIHSKAPDILAFSLYPWNLQRSLYIAQEAKKCLPHLRVVVGGPEVMYESAPVLSSSR